VFAQTTNNTNTIHDLKSGSKKCCINIPGVGWVQKFPTTKFKRVLDEEIKGDVRLNIFKGQNNGNIIKVIYAFPPKRNGVFLLDSSGNTLASITKNIFTNDGDEPYSHCDDVVSADINGDKKDDYFVCLTEVGNGIAWSNQGIFFLSTKTGYSIRTFKAYHCNSDDLVDLFGDGRCFLIDENLISDDNLSLPPKDFTEIPKDLDPEQKDLIRKGKFPPAFWNSLFFWVEYPVEIHEDKLIIATEVDKRFPVFASWFRGGWGGGSNGETTLLSKKEKQKLWDKNVKNVMDVPIRDKAFEMPKIP